MGDEVLVTGAAGFIGRHVAAACAAAGWQVTTLDQREAGPEVTGQADFWRTDLADARVLRAIRRGRFAAVLHLAGISSTVEDDWAVLERTNVTGPIRLAAACAASGARFIYASSHSVYGRIAVRAPVAENAGATVCSAPLNLYGRSKLLLDNRMAADFGTGLHWIGLRFTNVFGPGEQHKGEMASIISRLLRQAADGQELRVFSDTLEACRDYIPVGAVADTCAGLAVQPVTPGVYNLGSGHPVSFARLLQWCAEFSGQDIAVRLVPNPLSERYQFWTCADMAKLDAAWPERPSVTLEQVRHAARQLFRDFQAGRR
jgi:ADP-L-glycero-D-manno-heptose 6-epimerase